MKLSYKKYKLAIEDAYNQFFDGLISQAELIHLLTLAYNRYNRG